MLDKFTSIGAPLEDEIVINKSRFITKAYPISSEEEANNIIKELKKEHYKANHVCSAWILATDPVQQKASDDGEPSGTAGKPILEVLKRNDLRNVLVCVIRYFGGIKLGAGGLIRAYSESCSNVINNAVKVRSEVNSIIEIEIEYSSYQNLLIFLDKFNIKPISEDFTDLVKLTFYMPTELEDKFINLIQDYTNNNFLYNIQGQKPVQKNIEEKEILL